MNKANNNNKETSYTNKFAGNMLTNRRKKNYNHYSSICCYLDFK